MKLLNTVSRAIVNTIVSNIKLNDAILICALRAEQEEKAVLAKTLLSCVDEHQNTTHKGGK